VLNSSFDGYARSYGNRPALHVTCHDLPMRPVRPQPAFDRATHGFGWSTCPSLHVGSALCCPNGLEASSSTGAPGRRRTARGRTSAVRSGQLMGVSLRIYAGSCPSIRSSDGSVSNPAALRIST